MEKKRNAGRMKKDVREKERERVKGPSVCERGRGSRLDACLYVPSAFGAGDAGTRGNEIQRETQTECEAKRKERERIRETLERRGESRERRDRVPGGQDRFELSKIYGRRFDLRARGVTPGSSGQGP